MTVVDAPDLSLGNVVKDSIEGWSEAVGDVHTQLSFDVAGGVTFNGAMATTSIAQLRACKFSSTALTARRTKRDLARSSDGTTIMIWQLRGDSWASQGRRETHLPPGNLTFLDLDQPYIVKCAEGYGQIVLHVPTDELVDRLRQGGVRRDFRALALRPEGLAAPWLGFLRTALLESQNSAPGAMDPLYDASVGVLAELAALAVGSDAGEAPEELLRRAAIAMLQESYWRNDLTADLVAREQGVSRRTLFRAFDESGQGFAEALQDIRLSAAAKMLRQPASSLTVDAVGQSVGYASASTFYARFSTRFGISPGRYRRLKAGLGTLAENG